MRNPSVPLTRGALSAWPPLLATRGAGSRSEGHAHHGQHVVLATTGTLRICVRSGPWRRAAGIVTAPDVPHALDATGAEVLLVFLDPESDVGLALAGVMSDDVALLSGAMRDALLKDVTPASLMGADGPAWLAQLVTLLRGPRLPRRRTVHPRVRQVLRLLREAEVDADVSLEQLAAKVGLSPGRLMHVFTESVGVPLRPWLAWLKLQRAAASLVTGATVSEAAHAAGFSDAAHLSRTFRRMLGLTPSELQKAAS